MDKPHQHDDAEVVFLLRGKVGLLYRGQLLRQPEKRLFVFWGATPHRAVHAEAGTEIAVCHVPTAWFLQWGLPNKIIELFFAGEWLIEPDPDRSSMDEVLIKQWVTDYHESPELLLNVTLFELRARMHRLAVSWLNQVSPHKVKNFAPDKSWEYISKIAYYIATHYQELITIDEIAEAVGIKASHLMHLFRKRCGMTVMEYVTKFRLSHAQQMLATSDESILDIALESGFGSLSRFYAVFNDVYSIAPNRYRAQLQGKSAQKSGNATD